MPHSTAWQTDYSVCCCLILAAVAARCHVHCTGRRLTSSPRKATLFQEWPRHPWKIAGNFSSYDFHQFSPVVLVKLAEERLNILEAEWPTKILGKKGREFNAQSLCKVHCAQTGSSSPWSASGCGAELTWCSERPVQSKIKLKGRTDLALVSN